MKKPHTNQNRHAMLHIQHAGVVYQFPKKIADKYRISDESINSEDIFNSLNTKYTKPGALLHGIRIRENLTQVEMAKLIKVTQSDISQMENGTRNIGRTIAKRIQKLFDVDYRSFLQ